MACRYSDRIDCSRCLAGSPLEKRFQPLGRKFLEGNSESIPGNIVDSGIHLGMVPDRAVPLIRNYSNSRGSMAVELKSSSIQILESSLQKCSKTQLDKF